MVTLEACPLFRMLSQPELDALRQIASERNVAGGQIIFQEGDQGTGVYVVREGLVEISVAVGESGHRPVAEIAPGDLFGEMSVIEFKPRSATATAVRDSVVYFIPRDELLAMVERSPLLALSLLREISHRLREFNHRYLQEILQTEQLAVIGRFARSIVHDIKNPLHIISLTAEMSGMPQATPESRARAVTTIRRQTARVSEMVGEILDFTQGSGAALSPVPVAWAAFAGQLLEEIRPEVELRGSRLVVEGLPALEVPLDPQRLRRVFFNLIHNAVDAMPDGGTVFVRFTTTKQEITTEIEDTGPGIAPEIAEKLFEVFATFGKAHGTGLGLSICKKIIGDHHGRIWVRKEPGRGALFCFALPLPPPSGSPAFP